MNGIQKYDKDINKWGLINASLSGLTEADAKKEIAQLRKWAQEDGSDAKYRIIKTELMP